MTIESSLENGLLLRTLTDPHTGLPSVLYFRVVREWEERRAARHGGRVQTVRIVVRGGDEESSRRFTFGLCHEFRKGDLIASAGPTQFRLLLVGRDADQADAIRGRVERLAHETNARTATEASVDVEVTLEESAPIHERDAHELPNLSRIEDSGAVPRFDAGPDAT